MTRATLSQWLSANHARSVSIFPTPMFSLRRLHRAAPFSYSSPRIGSNCLRKYSDAPSTPPKPQQDANKQEKRVVFSGIQPTGVPHIGNYLGALKQWVELQNNSSAESTLLFSIVDLHAITIKQHPRKLAQCRKEMLASLLAVGLDPKRCIIFAQSSVKQHAELMWILSCNASMGYLWRMTQWKSKLALPLNTSRLDLTNPKNAPKLGLFSYPVLQASDVLLYNTTHVPVGQDQAQHLEFTRELAIGFNHLFSPNRDEPLLTVPQTLLSPAKRVMSLANFDEKMSKSNPKERSRIMINDSPEVIFEKVKKAITDEYFTVSYDPEKRPAVSNLIDLLYYFDSKGAPSPAVLAEDIHGIPISNLKEMVAKAIDKGIADVRAKYEDLMQGDEKLLVEYAEEGAQRAEVIAEQTMQRVRSAMGMAWS